MSKSLKKGRENTLIMKLDEFLVYSLVGVLGVKVALSIFHVTPEPDWVIQLIIGGVLGLVFKPFIQKVLEN